MVKQGMDRTDQRTVIERFSKDFNREMHNLRERPDTIFQQMYNRLQWFDKDTQGPVIQTIAPEFERRNQESTPRPWFHNRVKTRESEAYIRTFVGHTDSVYSVAFSPDGLVLASGSGDYTVRLWDARTGDELAVPTGHTNWVRSVAFSPDGRVLASGSWDNTVRLWDAETGKLIDIFKAIGSLYSCAFSPLNNAVACGDTGGNVYILEPIGFGLNTICAEDIQLPEPVKSIGKK